ncbi:MAG TPA: thermonuclease family protein [Azospirillum sp.]|nr:thermonuclease family protein [Azospirillum sp.]
MLGRVAPLFAALLLLAAASPADRLASAGSGRVSAVVDGGTLDLDDGRRVRLAGIEAAKPPPGREEERRWPLAEGATEALRELAQGRTVELHGVVEDRYGRWLAQVVRADGLWLQAELLRRGHARVQTRPDARELATELLAAEAEARTARRSIWRTHAYAVRAADDVERLRRDRDSFQIVEGRVVTASKVRGQVFLNFAEDWRGDFSVHIGRDAQRLFARAGVDPLALEGTVVRVRGWIAERNGPVIEATHPEQIERVEDAGPHPLPLPRSAREGEDPRDARGGWGQMSPDEDD